jgi:hypothetical protein
MTHMSFQLQLGKELSSKWAGWKHCFSIFAPLHPAVHDPQGMEKKKGRCHVYKGRTNQACPGCHGHICNGLCYWDIH